MQLRSDPEFVSLIPPLSDDEYNQLEANLLADGCRDAIVVWNDVIIDGNNRYKICLEHGLAYRQTEMQFDCREDAIIWICNNQKGRRNMTPEQKSYLRGKEYDAIKMKQGSNNRHVQKSKKSQGETFYNTAEILAEKHNVARCTVHRDAHFSRGVDAVGTISPEAKQRILAGKSGLSKKDVEKLSQRPKSELDTIAHQIENGERVYSAAIAAPPIVRQSPKEEAKSIRRHVAELKDSSIDRSYTTEHYLIEYTAFAQRFGHTLEGYDDEPYKTLDTKLNTEEREHMISLNKTMISTIGLRISTLQKGGMRQ